MAECEKYRELISSYADGELPDEEKMALEQHLEQCPGCQALLSAYRDISEAAEESMEEPPEALAGLVMARIRALPEGATMGPGRKTRKAFMPVVISFVAVAACLALVFVAAPQMFNFSGSTKSMPGSAYAPEAEAASSPVLPDNDAGQYAAMKTAPSDQTDAAPTYGADVPSDEAKSTASPVQTLTGSVQRSATATPTPAAGTATSPTPEPSSVPPVRMGTLQSTESGTVSLEKYYAVITVTGQLPDLLKAEQQTDNGDGTFNIEVSVQTAEQLIGAKYEAVLGNKDAAAALVVYTPAS